MYWFSSRVDRVDSLFSSINNGIRDLFTTESNIGLDMVREYRARPWHWK